MSVLRLDLSRLVGRHERLRLAAVLLVTACRDPGVAIFPSTALGQTARDWLTAHNRGEGHAMVHFTMENRGTAPISGAQSDSIVHAGVELAQQLGPLSPVRLLESSDTSLAVLLRSANGGEWRAEFRPATQPGLVKVAVRVDPSP